MSAFSLVTLGCAWRVGDGNKIKVWHDPWLCQDEDSFVETPMVDGLEDLWVSDLIHDRTWDVTLVETLFNN